jgi:tripartite ATP-independent transporter DctM subunit
LVFCLAALVLLPLSERFLRAFFNTGILGVSDFTLHFSLFIGMLGGAIAARENKLLAISTISTFLKGRWKLGVQMFANSFGVAVCIFLFLASYEFIQTEKVAGKILPYSIPVWILQTVMPFGFSVIAIRLLWRSAPQWWGRLLTLAVAGVIVWFGVDCPVSPEKMFWPALVLLLVATFLGAPIFTALGGLAVIYFWTQELPISIVSVSHYSLVVEPMVPTIPLFTLAGYFLAESKASQRLVRVFHAIFGRIRGGPVVVTVLVCAFFTTFTGASGVTILALGGLLMPVLLSAKFPEKSAVGLLTGAGSLGLLFPPCLPLIFYFIVANSNSQGGMQLQDIFLGGVIPGCLLLAMTSAWGVFKAPRVDISAETVSGKEIRQALWEAKWELMLPVVALGSLFSGIFSTPVAAAAVTALYAFVVETFIMRDLNLFRDVPRVITQCGLLVGGVLLILGMAFGFSNCLVDAQVPDMAIEWVTTHIESKILFLLILNILLIVVGCFMDIFSAIVVVVPLLVPLGLEYGIDPIHLGIIFLANMELGYLTPPVGMNLFLSSYRFNKPVMEIAKDTLPMFFVLLAGVLVITYVPFLTTWLPSLFR